MAFTALSWECLECIQILNPNEKEKNSNVEGIFVETGSAHGE